jgi:hypothetical protein
VLVRDQATIETYNRVVEDVSDDLWVMPFGHEIGATDDHIHLDLGYLTLVPREIAEDPFERRRDSPRFAFEERRRGDRRGWPAPEDLAGLVHDQGPDEGEPD